jgi:hypothetical protein
VIDGKAYTERQTRRLFNNEAYAYIGIAENTLRWGLPYGGCWADYPQWFLWLNKEFSGRMKKEW